MVNKINFICHFIIHFSNTVLSAIPQGPGSSRSSGLWRLRHGDGARHRPGSGAVGSTPGQDVEGEKRRDRNLSMHTENESSFSFNVTVIVV